MRTEIICPSCKGQSQVSDLVCTVFIASLLALLLRRWKQFLSYTGYTFPRQLLYVFLISNENEDFIYSTNRSSLSTVTSQRFKSRAKNSSQYPKGESNPSSVNHWINKLSMLYPHIQLEKGMEYWYTCYTTWTNLETWCWVTGATRKRPHSIWFHLHERAGYANT